MKVLYINYIPSPYRIDFFNTLAKKCNLDVVYYYKTIAERPNWKYNEKQHHYAHQFLYKKERTIETAAFKKLYKLIRSRDYDIIVVGGYARIIEIIAIIELRLLKIPFVLNTDGGFINTNPLKLKLKRFLVKSASWYLASGKVAAETLEYYGAPHSKIFNYRFSSIFRNEVLDKPLSLNEKKKIRKTLGLPENGKIIITIGRYISLKGYEYAIEAFHKLNAENSFMFMLGEGELREEYQTLISEYNLNNKVFLTGEKTKEIVLEYCKAADVMILPTITSDVWGLVVNEAMSCGLPVIATNRVGAAHDMIIDNKTGFMVSPNSSEEIKSALEKIFSSSTEDAVNVLNIAKEYTIESMVNDHISCFSKIRTK